MDNILTLFFIFALGAIVGSFLNVVALRFNTGMSIVIGRSGCFSCGKNLLWQEMIPIVSFLYLGGKCSHCKSRISWQYPIVEAIAGILFVGAWLINLPFLGVSLGYFVAVTLSFWAIISILLVISIYDLLHKIIPDQLVYSFIILAFIGNVAIFYNNFALGTLDKLEILNFLAGPILFLPFFLLWLVSLGKWIGLGDAKLAIGIGWLLGFVYGLSAVFLAFWIGAIVSVCLLILNFLVKKLSKNSGLSFVSKNLTIKSEIPFAPFLILGTLIVLFFQIDVTGLEILFQTYFLQ